VDGVSQDESRPLPVQMRTSSTQTYGSHP